MNAFTRFLGVSAIAVALALAATVVTSSAAVGAEPEKTMTQGAQAPVTAADHLAEAAKYEQEARDLDAKAAEHKGMGQLYRTQRSAGSKQGAASQSLVSHCDRLVKSYTQAAAEARALAKAHRDMAKSN